MSASQIYIAIAIIVLAIIALFVFFVSKNKKKKKFTPLTGLAFGFILAGIFSISIFEDSRLISYSLFGIAIIIAVVDIVLRLRKN